MILIGRPGSGKTMMARRLPSVLPPMTMEEALEATKLYSVSGLLSIDAPLINSRPFRSPHHTVSTAALVGGGTVPKPGEVSLSHHGVLFLDELPEFNRDALEVLRQPLGDGVVNVSRVSASYTYPADFCLIAAMNPCPCGYFGDVFRQCTCSKRGNIVPQRPLLNQSRGVVLALDWSRQMGYIWFRRTRSESLARCSTGSTSG